MSIFAQGGKKNLIMNSMFVKEHKLQNISYA